MPSPDSEGQNTPTMPPRTAIAMLAMHGELASQGGKIDWSGRPGELAELSVGYADALLAALAATQPDEKKG